MKRRNSKWLTLALLPPLAFSGCAGGLALAPVASIAVTGATKAAQASRPISESEEYYLGRAVAARIFSQYTLSRNTRLNHYVNEVGQTVARKSNRPQTFRGYHFGVLDTDELNAFACPGGLILITRGLVQTCESEDQLAAVLAHEVAHIAHRDGVNSVSKARWSEVLTAMGTQAVRQYGGVAGNLISLFEGSIDDVFKTMVVNGYSREAEFAADQEAVVTLQKAGYDPQALSQVLEKMMARQKDNAGGIFKTHPPTSVRLAKVKTTAPCASPPTANNRRQRFKEEVG